VAHNPPYTRHTWLRRSHAGTVGGANCIRRGRRWRRNKLPREINIATTPDYTNNATTSTAAHCSPELAPLAVALGEGAGPHIWVDPMLDKLAASLVTSRSMGAPVLRPSTLTTATLEA
jgi:hypothetical protein